MSGSTDLLTSDQAAEIHLRCVINGLEMAVRASRAGKRCSGLVLEESLHQAYCCMDVLLRSQADAAYDADIQASRAAGVSKP